MLLVQVFKLTKQLLLMPLFLFPAHKYLLETGSLISLK